MGDSIPKLEAERSALLQGLASTGDMRRGSINEVYRPCGKQACACSAPNHPGHGPYYAFTTKVGGKTKTLQLRPGPLLTKIEREVAAYRAFRDTCGRLFDISDAICEARPFDAAAAAEKKGARGHASNGGRRRGRSARRHRRRRRLGLRGDRDGSAPQGNAWCGTRRGAAH